MPHTNATNPQNDESLRNALLSLGYQQDMSRRSAMKALIGAASAAVLFSSPIRALATPSASKETTDALASAQARLDEVSVQMDELSSQFQALSEEQDRTIGEIEVVQEDIDETQELIEEKQEELEEKQEILADRVASNYKSGGDNGLALLLSSKSLDDLLSNTYYVNKVNASDQRAIDEVHDIQEELETTKAELEAKKADLEVLKADQAAQLEQMKAKKDEVQALVDSLDQDVKGLIAKRDAEILAAVQAEEEARRAAEEAAKHPSTSIPGDGQGSSSAGNLQQLVVSWCHKTPSPGAGLCAWWVSDVFERAGLGSVSGNADDMYNAWCTSSKKSNLQVAMIIAVSSHSHTWAGQIYGHVGIYVGDNTVMDNIGYIRSINVDSWIAYYGDVVTPRWGWANGRNLAG
ncbi:MAG: hypothetical protein SOU51_05505 [Collinsella sp.]|nr:hypothetical protein [Collinsella sp.]